MHSCCLQQLLPAEFETHTGERFYNLLRRFCWAHENRFISFLVFADRCDSQWGLLDSRFGILSNQRCLPWLFEWLFDLSLPSSLIMNFSKSFWPKYSELVDYNNFRRLEMKDSTPHSWANASDVWWTPAETPISMHSLTKINQDNLQQLALFRCKLVRLNRTRRQS